MNYWLILLNWFQNLKKEPKNRIIAISLAVLTVLAGLILLGLIQFELIISAKGLFLYV